MAKISLTGIKPTGDPHIGNYLGMIQPALALMEHYRCIYFIADYHALTVLHNPRELTKLTYEVAATWLALGLDPEQVLFYRQSDVPEIPEFTWILSCFCAKGLLNRAHAYKAAVDKNLEAGNNPDDGINVGLYNYPVLMSADILLFGSHVVPVGADQRQHIEIARDIAQAFTHTYGDLLVLPEALIDENVMIIPGLDGRKMSKSYGNVIPLFHSRSQVRKQVMRIVTDSTPVEMPKDPDQCNVFAIYRYFAPPEAVATMRQRYVAGGVGYGEVKQELAELLEARFSAARERYNAYLADKAALDRILEQGAEKARAIAAPTLTQIRKAIGIQRH